MGSPNVTGNYKGYDESDLTKHVNGLHDKKILLVHGTADESVHLQQRRLLSRSLSKHGILFDQQIYTDESHLLSGVRNHLFRTMTKFFDDCFKRSVSFEFIYFKVFPMN